MELKFNEAKTVRPNHLERCLCYDKFLKGFRCYVYDDINKYWCTQETTEHDPDGENHIVDYADYQVIEWASLSNVNQPSLPSNLDEAANRQAILEHPYKCEEEQDGSFCVTPLFVMSNIRSAFKAGAEWMAGQFQKIEGELVDWYSTSDGKDYCCGVKTIDAFEVPEGFYIRKK